MSAGAAAGLTGAFHFLSGRRWSARALHLAFAAGLLLSAAAWAAEDDARHYNLSPGPAVETLPEFARLADVQLVFPAQAAVGVRTNALRGEFAPRPALERLLAGTELEVLFDDVNRTYAVRRTLRSPALPPDVPTSRPARRRPTEPAMLMSAVTVENRRDFGVATQSILPTDRAAPLYHHVVTREAIEQSGASNMAEFLTTVPGYSGEGAEPLQATADLTFGSANVYRGSFLKLRGWDARHTTVLLNGRQLPASPESRGPDLSRIPLAAVERIEVLPFAGSALYGDGAVGGAMNIVLRRNFAGRAVSLQVGGATRGGAQEALLTWIEGLASADGRTRATVTGDFQRRSELRLGERDFLSRAIAQVPPGKLLSDGGPFGPDLRAVLRAELTGYPAAFAVASSNVELGIPEQPGAQFALVPAGRNAAQLPRSAFVQTDPTAVGERRQDRVVLRAPSASFNGGLQLEHAWMPDRLELYGEVGYSRVDERFSAPDAIEPLALGTDDPRNPFRRDGAADFSGRSVNLFFDPVDLPDAAYRHRRDSAGVVLGVRGTPASRLHWSVDIYVDLSRSQATVESYGGSLNELLRRWTPARADALVAIYDPLADHRAAPVAREVRDRYLARHAWLDHRGRTFGAEARIGGVAAELPAGALRLELGAEYERRDRTTHQQVNASRELYDRLGDPAAFAAVTRPLATFDRGDRLGALAEAIVPLARQGRAGLPLHGAELNFASRVARTDDGHPAASTLLALKVAPSRSWALRGTFSQGHVTPPSAVTNTAVIESSAPVGVVDPLRGNVRQFYPLQIVQGGSPALRAETSQARVLGVVLTPAGLPDCFLSIDAWSIRMRDRLRAPTVQELVSHAEFFPGKIERALPLSWESALGWSGPVTRADLRPVHVTRLEASGLDVSFRYRLPATRAGTFTWSSQWETVQRYAEQFLPVTPSIDKIDLVADGSSDGLMEAAVVSPRGRTTLSWQRGAWFASTTATYTPRYRTESTTPTAARPAATGLDGEFIGSSTRWDLQIGLAVAAAGHRGVRSWISDTTWTVGARNVLDRDPPGRADGTSFYSRFDDPRLRFLYLRVQWRR